MLSSFDSRSSNDGLVCEASPMTGNPINLGTGNKYQHEYDYASADSFPLIFDRHYNSDTPSDSSLGSNFLFFNIFLNKFLSENLIDR